MDEQLLFVSQVAPYRDGPAGVHGVLEQAAIGVAQLAELNALEPVRVDDVRAIEPEEWSRTRALVLFTIGETPWNVAQRLAILAGLRAGRLAVVAVHSATDSCYAWDDYGAVVGARFDGHPWTQTFAAEVCDATHPACAHLGAEWSWHDEVYQFRDLRPDARVLLRVRDGELDLTVPGARPPAFGYPLAWCFEEGAGRVFSTALGHFPSAWESPTYLRHLGGGLAWALGAAP
ncbi:MAG: ThuA domain-containing protein [Actinomycetota bacterium]|nr:ThuA domain-containing protein [Actinomycetota bacterium]